mgnify:CR=1 FL=1
MTLVTDWTRVRHYAPIEWRDDPDRALPDLVYLMDDMREDAGRPVRIHVCWEAGGHVQDSSHYATFTEYATGVDFNIEGWSLLDQWLFVERYAFSGIGIYPFWRAPGLHADLRRLGRDHPRLGKRWWRDDRLTAPKPNEEDRRYKPIDRELLALLLAHDEKEKARGD